VFEQERKKSKEKLKNWGGGGEVIDKSEVYGVGLNLSLGKVPARVNGS
jgi:hypothetical protein